MSESKEKKYVGFGKEVGNYGMLSISIPESKVKAYWKEYKGERYLNLNIGSLREKTQYGQTHTVWIDEFKPKEGTNNSKGNSSGDNESREFAKAGDGLPF